MLRRRYAARPISVIQRNLMLWILGILGIIDPTGLDKLARSKVAISNSIETPSQGVRAFSRHHNLCGPFRGSSVRLDRKGIHMPLNFVVDYTCPRCGSTIRHAVIDIHPTDRDAAIHSLKCADCGYEKTRVLLLRPTAAPPELTARHRRGRQSGRNC